ncbi:gamma-glutamylcyclotransferase [Halomonas sp. HMF6819]|uniref:gamma-glutamylcyclotransferase n=1 Tax=Halomonas sp. HMF6819 TaxID=3373085 RepID=UPI003794A766
MSLADDIAVTPLVAVYGTLKKGLNNAHLLEAAEFVGADTSRVLTLYDVGPYPGAKQRESKGIALEVYRINEAMLARLDVLEDHRIDAPDEGEYQRVTLTTRFGPAWVYLYNPDIVDFIAIDEGGWPLPR